LAADSINETDILWSYYSWRENVLVIRFPIFVSLNRTKTGDNSGMNQKMNLKDTIMLLPNTILIVQNTGNVEIKNNAAPISNVDLRNLYSPINPSGRTCFF
jgi:hypothetical protein